MADPAVVTTEGQFARLAAITTAPAAGPATVILVIDGHDFATNPSFVASIVGDEIVATGYARQLATFQAPVIQADGRVTVDIDVTDFGLVGNGVNATVGGCYLFADSGNDATAPVLACLPFVTPKTTDGTQLTIAWPPNTITDVGNVGIG